MTRELCAKERSVLKGRVRPDFNRPKQFDLSDKTKKELVDCLRRHCSEKASYPNLARIANVFVRGRNGDLVVHVQLNRSAVVAASSQHPDFGSARDERMQKLEAVAPAFRDEAVEILFKDEAFRAHFPGYESADKIFKQWSTASPEERDGSGAGAPRFLTIQLQDPILGGGFKSPDRFDEG